MRNIPLITLMLTAALGAPAYAHGTTQPPSLLNALVSVGNHGAIANVAATVASPNSLADVKANVLDNTVKANVDVAPAPAAGHYDPAPSHGSSALADVNLNVLNTVRANVAVGETGRHSDTLLGISATVLDGGVGNRNW